MKPLIFILMLVVGAFVCNSYFAPKQNSVKYEETESISVELPIKKDINNYKQNKVPETYKQKCIIERKLDRDLYQYESFLRIYKRMVLSAKEYLNGDDKNSYMLNYHKLILSYIPKHIDEYEQIKKEFKDYLKSKGVNALSIDERIRLKKHLVNNCKRIYNNLTNESKKYEERLDNYIKTANMAYEYFD